MLWLRADLDRPSCCAAAVKLPQRARGEAVFYEIYAEADKRRDLGKRHTGIFMFKGRDNAPFAMIAPGGGFAYVGSLHEGFPIARRVAAQGYTPSW